jgi:general secretion pathway protein D
VKLLTLILAIFTVSLSQAENKIKMYYKNEDLTKIIEFYSKVSGQKFVVDATVRGKISLYLQEPVSIEEAFNQLSSALALNGYAISKQGDTMVISAARNIQRDLIEVSTERPVLKPQRLYTWIYNVRHLPADRINREFRILPSKEGEMSVSTNTNQLIFTDWVSNINRVAELLKEIDKPLDTETAKLVEASKNQSKARNIENVNEKENK